MTYLSPALSTGSVAYRPQRRVSYRDHLPPLSGDYASVPLIDFGQLIVHGPDDYAEIPPAFVIGAMSPTP